MKIKVNILLWFETGNASDTFSVSHLSFCLHFYPKHCPMQFDRLWQLQSIQLQQLLKNKSNVVHSSRTNQRENAAFIYNNLRPLRLSRPRQISKQPVTAAAPMWVACSNHGWCPLGCGNWWSISFLLLLFLLLLSFSRIRPPVQFYRLASETSSWAPGLSVLLYLEKQ